MGGGESEGEGNGGIGRGQSSGGAGGDDAVAASALGLVEGVVGELEEKVDAIGGFLEGGDADGDGKSAGSLRAGRSARLPEALADLLGAQGGLMQGTLGEDESKFFAAVAANHVFGAHATQKGLAEFG